MNIIMMGATGAVGTEVVGTLLESPALGTLTLLGRRPLESIKDHRVVQQNVDIFTPSTYSSMLPNHDCAICTLGVGEPSKMPKADFVRIDKTAVLDFTTQCKKSGVSHFHLLSSVGVDAKSRSFFLHTKGELQEELKNLNFDSLSLIHPSMILTPENRYGLSQAITLAVWPWLSHLMIGPLQKFRGVPVETLGTAIAMNALNPGKGIEVLEWADFNRLAETPMP